jgi:hypothetical protein
MFVLIEISQGKSFMGKIFQTFLKNYFEKIELSKYYFAFIQTYANLFTKEMNPK